MCAEDLFDFFGSFRHAPPAQINGKDHYFQVLIELNTLKQSTLSLKRPDGVNLSVY